MIIHGNCLDVLKELEDNILDSIVTDPPYGLKFMGKKWDYDVPTKEIWIEVLRVLKPGGHLLSFGGTRTYHRLVVAIEDAGFEVRDQIQWLYGSGFPKSHNIKEGEFKGWGTALKPANEPIVLARKPLEKGLTVAQNVEKWGVGGLNINESRIEGTFKSGWSESGSKESENTAMSGKNYSRDPKPDSPQGRWPANLILDETAAEMLGEPSRFFYCAKASTSERNAGLEGMPLKKRSDANKMMGDAGPMKTGSGNDRTTEFQNHHPTIKPIELMEYLIRLITPPGGVVLDPLTGSGSTGVAAIKNGFEFIGIEMNEEYVEIATKRLEHAETEKKVG